ncbi:hypothetical protein [Streptomyces sp900129855]|uniref:Uncharacterized protein n=1 Tax=Streptomyces sp. 900129855 TaxID=3155129 RepID=A0ABV2ZY13_9ACTN
MALAGEVEQIWRMCRPHERILKTASVRTVSKAEPPAGDEPVIVCRVCDRVLTPSSHACPDCGSPDRFVTSMDEGRAYECLDLRARHEANEEHRTRIKIKAGDNYTRDLEAWGHRELVIDKEHNRYREVIELYDGSRITSTALLSDH